MAKGLKQLVSEALDQIEAEQIEPVEVSDEALRALSIKMREWSGWSRANLVFGDPRPVSPFASCNPVTRTFTVNADRLVRNPNRVLLTVTPFRLKQEAVLTGCMLHEAGHARHSRWLRRTKAEAEANPLVHGGGSTHEGEPVTATTIKFARLLEEPRVEGLMARNAPQVGATGLEWTMRASAADLLPMTGLNQDPSQRVMDLIKSWVLRAGRRMAANHWLMSHVNNPLPQWVADFTSLLHGVLIEHLSQFDDNPQRTAQKVIDQLLLMMVCVDDTGTYMVDSARDVLDMLFPETNGEPDVEPGGGCSAEGNADSSQSEAGGDESTGEEVSDESDTDQSGDQPGQPGQPGEAESEEGKTEEPDTTSDLAKALAAVEGKADDQTEDEAEEQQDAPPGGEIGGIGSGQDGDGTEYRAPTKEEYEIQKGAERFLRAMIDPTEAAKVQITDQPSSQIDAVAHAAWKAGGMHGDPRFFRRSRRTVMPSPPVRIAILVDISGSMDEMQKPSGILAWSMASAALDLRNFAGRGQQIESCLILWGSNVYVKQKVNEQVPGIREYPCTEGTSAFAEAMDEVENQMPGFFDVPTTPVNRLIVNFTDWDLNRYSRQAANVAFAKMLESGVNMLSVVPRDYSVRYSALPDMLMNSRIQRGKASIIKYNPAIPGQVWDTAAEMLDGGTPAPFAGF